jgi:cysteine desulfurase
MTNRIYLDHAATTPLDEGVLAEMLPWLTTGYGNANALYAEGRAARDAIVKARKQLAAAISAAPVELTFCSGGTEANNLTLAGIVCEVRRRKGSAKANHLICSSIEHGAVLEPLKALRNQGFELTIIDCQSNGLVNPEALERAIRPDTILASAMLVNNELGTIQPVRELAQIAHAQGVLFHTDAVQALGKIPIDVNALGVDALTVSAHKLYGPKGVGALYLKQGTPYEPQMRGGGQENNRRSGTLNTAGIVGLGAAAELACDEKLMAQRLQKLQSLRDYLFAELEQFGSKITPTVPEPASPTSKPDPTRQYPAIVSLLVDGIESQTIIQHLDAAGIAAAGGSACTTKSLKPSHVLTAIGIPKNRAVCSLRLSMGKTTTRADLERLVESLGKILP